MESVILIALMLSVSWGTIAAYENVTDEYFTVEDNEATKTGIVQFGGGYYLPVVNGVVDTKGGIFQVVDFVDVKYEHIDIEDIRIGILDIGDGIYLYIKNGALDFKAGIHIPSGGKDITHTPGISELVEFEDGGGHFERRFREQVGKHLTLDVIITGVVDIGGGAYLIIKNGAVDFEAGLHKMVDREGGIYKAVKRGGGIYKPFENKDTLGDVFSVEVVEGWDKLWKRFVQLEIQYLESHGKMATEELEDVQQQLKYKIQPYLDKAADIRSQSDAYIIYTVKYYVAIPEYYLNLNRNFERDGNTADFDTIAENLLQYAKSMQSHFDVYRKVMGAAPEN